MNTQYDVPQEVQSRHLEKKPCPMTGLVPALGFFKLDHVVESPISPSSTSLELGNSKKGSIVNAISARRVEDLRLEIRILSWPNTGPDDHVHRTEGSRHC